MDLTWSDEEERSAPSAAIGSATTCPHGYALG